MADLASRIRLVEKQLHWLMSTMRMRAVISSGVLDAKGQPIPTQTFDGTMLELYHLSKKLQAVTESEMEPPPLGGGSSDAN